jgi:hypothetical protein
MSDQDWFWTPEWQAKEREADEDIAAGRFERFYSDEEFLAAMQQEAAQAYGAPPQPALPASRRPSPCRSVGLGRSGRRSRRPAPAPVLRAGSGAVARRS